MAKTYHPDFLAFLKVRDMSAVEKTAMLRALLFDCIQDARNAGQLKEAKKRLLASIAPFLKAN